MWEEGSVERREVWREGGGSVSVATREIDFRIQKHCTSLKKKLFCKCACVCIYIVCVHESISLSVYGEGKSPTLSGKCPAPSPIDLLYRNLPLVL